jgi:molybdopterin molybdotransferase
MILVEEAIQILDQTPVEPKTEEVDLSKALFRILAQDVVSKIDMPPFNKSAMDGYAIRSNDPSPQLQIVDTIPAGTVPKRRIQEGQCAKIMTGGMVPEGADRVIKKELTIEKNGFMEITGEEKNQNICFQAEDIKIGDVVLRKGTLIRPAEVGILASMGLARLAVYKKPQVGIMTTGSELVKPGHPIKAGQIYDSNLYSLAAQVTQTGASLSMSGIVVDTRDKIYEAIEELLNTCDLVLISGGVSAGDFDYVPIILKKLGVRLFFEKVAIKPGKPTVYGTWNKKIVFGIPGNPVSTFVVFEIFIKPLLHRMMGFDFHPIELQGILSETYSRRKTTRSVYIPVHYRKGAVEQLNYHGSAHIRALGQANGLINIPRGIKEIPSGSTVNVRLI